MDADRIASARAALAPAKTSLTYPSFLPQAVTAMHSPRGMHTSRARIPHEPT